MMCAETITLLKDIFISAAAIATAYAAVTGVQNWSKELKGKAEFKLARNLIRATYKLRDEVKICRTQYIGSHEFPEDYFKSKEKHTPKEEAEAWAYVYNSRWQPVWNALQEFDVQTLEAEALWGSGIRKKTDQFREYIRILNIAIDAIVTNKLSGGEDFKQDKSFAERMKTTASDIGGDTDNNLSKKIIAVVEKIEDQIRPHLKRS